jgi:hypothetical protein
MELDAIQRDRSIKNFNIDRDLGKTNVEQKNRRNKNRLIAEDYTGIGTSRVCGNARLLSRHMQPFRP